MRDTILHVRVPFELMAALDKRAGQEYRTRNNMAVLLIAQGLDGDDLGGDHVG
jgi:hypothetical protein